MGEFRFPHTCGKIDRAIAEADASILRNLQVMAGEDSDEPIQYRVHRWADIISSEVRNAFETIRSLNMEMRDEATYQIQQVELQLEAAERGIEDAIYERNEERDRARELEEQLNDLREELHSRSHEEVLA